MNLFGSIKVKSAFLISLLKNASLGTNFLNFFFFAARRYKMARESISPIYKCHILGPQYDMKYSIQVSSTFERYMFIFILMKMKFSDNALK